MAGSKAEEDEWIKGHFIGNGSRPGRNQSNWNRWCSMCLAARVQELLDQEADEYAGGFRYELRSEEEIKVESK